MIYLKSGDTEAKSEKWEARKIWLRYPELSQRKFRASALAVTLHNNLVHNLFS